MAKLTTSRTRLDGYVRELQRLSPINTFRECCNAGECAGRHGGRVEKDVLKVGDRVDVVRDSLDAILFKRTRVKKSLFLARQRKKSDRNMFRPLIRRDEE